MDPLDAVTGTFALLILMVALGWTPLTQFVSAQQERRRALEQQKREQLNPPAICQCGHGLAFHKPSQEGSGACAAEVDAEVGCRCQQYVGPEPLPQFHV